MHYKPTYKTTFTTNSINSFNDDYHNGGFETIDIERKIYTRKDLDSYGSSIKYLYTPQNVWAIRFLGFFGLFSVIMAVFGYSYFFTQSWINLIFIPSFIFIVYNYIVNLILTTLYPKFDINKHQKYIADYWANNPEPAVDVFLPIAGEDTEILRKTWEGVLKLDYTNVNFFVLDDGADDKAKALAEELGFNYLVRPNRGEWKKAGNLQYGYDNSNEEYTLVLDADFIPFPWALKETIPYMEDSKISILQTPQFFINTKEISERSAYEYGAGYMVEDFYKILLPARNLVKLPICVGTSAIYRRSALEAIGGTPKIGGSEDVATGLNTMWKGFYVKFLPIIISHGLNPDNYDAHFKQQQRWCNGSVSMLFTDYFKKAKMSFLARLVYLTSFSYYIGEALKPFFGFHILLLLIFQYHLISFGNSIWFFPFLIYNLILIPLSRTQRTSPGLRIVGMSQIYTYIISLFKLVFKIKTSWVPTGQTKSKVSNGSIQALFTAGAVLLFTTFGYIFAIATNHNLLLNRNVSLLNYFILESIFNHLIFILYGISQLQVKRGNLNSKSIFAKTTLYYWAIDLFMLLNTTWLLFIIINIL